MMVLSKRRLQPRGRRRVVYLTVGTHRGGRAPFSGSCTLGLNRRGRKRKLKQEYYFKILGKRTTSRSARWSGAEAFSSEEGRNPDKEDVSGGRD